jgi:hypothetical protein
MTPPISANAIPNAANSLNALTEADIQRIAYHGALSLAAILFNETLEIQRGVHSHIEACGSMQVTPDITRNVPQLGMNWNMCDLNYGLFASGSFLVDWSEFNQDAGRMSMIVQGPITFGGGVPTITLSRMEWSASGISSLPGTIRISGRLVRGTLDRSFSFDVIVDD